MLFSEIIGQTQIKQELLETVRNNRISHALLFYGPEGSGKLSLAIAYAQYINCEQKGEKDSCGVCPSCLKYNKLQHPDLHFVFPVATNTKVKKDPVSDNFIAEWREIFLQQPYMSLDMWLAHIGVENKQGSIQREESREIMRKLNLKTYEAEYKVMIIWMAEKMNETCANKLLKILEEPPAKTLFVLISEHTEDLMATILSRTQIIRIPKIDDESMRQKLASDFSVSGEDLETLVHNANGNYFKAFELMSFENSNSDFFNYFTQIMRLAYAKNLPELSTISETMAGIGREKQKGFFEYALKMLRENFILNQKKQEIVYLYKKEKDFSEKFHSFINERNIAQLTKEFNEAHYHIERNGNAKIIFFDLFIKIMMLLRS
ncbi:MAG TPA: DNA polymerase III subunit delta' [Bacteroidales bacterium]|nr:MAG: DNA polymerase III subunit tau [Bacteroidetes bacterium ADurb.Bin217]HOS84065.1 DNA polymerase III subunit delta' [Bacteroidales bacterium]HPM12469.1 DNA polymerase III subunit delta' [Bacteroidales bacterium]